MTKSMLNVQYRFDESLARYPSRKFYNNQLMTGTDVSDLQEKLQTTDFPWPKSPRTNVLIPNVFVPCSAEEDYGGQSKQNIGQAKLVAHIVRLLMPERSQTAEKPLSVAVLTPYTKQVKYLQTKLPNGATAHTVDGFQGREADFIVYSSVRCNQKRDIGFLTDERRLNVAWTRARVGRIVVGDLDTLINGTAAVSDNAEAAVKVNTLWREAIEDCRRVDITLPEDAAPPTGNT
jgi:superfamily I DNA and/or RNA helicase